MRAGNIFALRTVIVKDKNKNNALKVKLHENNRHL